MNGLRIELFVDEPKSSYTMGTNFGIHVSIGNRSTANSDLLGIDVSTGFETNILVDRIFAQKLPEPYSDCQTLNNLQNKQILHSFSSLNASYNQQDCFGICFQIYMIENCKCYDPTFLYVETSYGPCATVEETYCNFEKFSSFFSEHIQDKCPDCTLECDSWRYHLTNSFTNYPTKAYAHQLMKNPIVRSKFQEPDQVTYEELKKKLLFLNIYYDELKYATIIEIEKTSFLDLIASVGGTMGLFIGVSFLSFMELIEIILKILFAIKKNKERLNSNK